MSEDRKDGDERTDAPSSEQSFFIDDLSFAMDGEGRVELPLPPNTETFRFVREIGRGGMGVVYEAEDLIAGRPVAIKLVHPGLSLSPAARERFEREARTAASIHHDRCVFVYGAHSIDGIPAIAMELMTGETLADRVQDQGPIDAVTALAWIEDVLDGLETAHETGLIHRDIKPSNLFLDTTGRLKIGDFGLSRPESGDLSLTRSGMFLGSPLYCSPEQARGREIDARSDVYSVGATLYALLTGRAPFEATNIGDLFARIATEEPTPPRSLVASIPIGLDRVIMKAMAKDPKDRFRSAREMRIALTAYQPGSQSNAALGLRFVAFMIDLLAIAILYAIVEAALLAIFWTARSGPALLVSPLRLDFAVRELNSAFIFLFYFIGFETWRGTTPGKFLFGLRVIREGGGRPTLMNCLLRSGFFAVEEVINVLSSGLAPALTSLLNVLALTTMRRRNGFRGLHEFISGTRTVAIRSRARRLIERRNAFDPRRTDDPHTDVTPPGGYQVVARVADVSEHELLLVHDPRLTRNVWLVPKEAVDDLGDTDLRWLDGPPGWAVFEDPGGASLFGYARQRPELDWTRLREYLLELTELFERDPRTEFARIWIDRRGRLRHLPFAISPEGAPVMAENEGFVASVRALSGGEKRRWVDDLPEGGSNFLKRARGDRTPFADAAEARAALLDLGEPGEPPTRGLRIAHFLFSTFAYSVGISAVLGVALFIFDIEAADENLVFRPFVFTAAYILGIVIPNMFLAGLLRGGPIFGLLNLRVFDRGGERASALRSAMRAFALHLPVLALGLACGLLEGFLDRITAADGGGLAVFLGGSMVYAGLALIYALIRPAHSLADLVTRTHLTHLGEASPPERE